MNFNLDGGVWKLGLLALAAVMNYGAGFFSDKFTNDEQKKMTVKITLKVAAFAIAIFAAIAVMFL